MGRALWKHPRVRDLGSSGIALVRDDGAILGCMFMLWTATFGLLIGFGIGWVVFT